MSDVSRWRGPLFSFWWCGGRTSQTAATRTLVRCPGTRESSAAEVSRCRCASPSTVSRLRSRGWSASFGLSSRLISSSRRAGDRRRRPLLSTPPFSTRPCPDRGAPAGRRVANEGEWGARLQDKVLGVGGTIPSPRLRRSLEPAAKGSLLRVSVRPGGGPLTPRPFASGKRTRKNSSSYSLSRRRFSSVRSVCSRVANTYRPSGSLLLNL